MPGGAWMRVAVWVAVLVVVVVGQYVWRSTGATIASQQSAPEETEASLIIRQATVEEWQLPIAELGRQKMGKRLVWRPIGTDVGAPRGALVWWHDGSAERLAYLPAPDEKPEQEMMQIMRGLSTGRVALYNVHGDEDLQQRIFDVIQQDWQYPLHMGVLLPPPVPKPETEPKPGSETQESP